MLEMFFNFFPEWIALYKTPMSPGARKLWGRFRKLGCAVFVVGVTLCLGGLAIAIDFCWDLMVERQSRGDFDFAMHFAWWFSGALIVGTVEWFLNESRFRLPAKSVSSKGLDLTNQA